MPKAIKYGILILMTLAMIPPALIARLRAVPSEKPRVHLIQDMDNQPKFRAQHATAIFTDGRAMRPPVHGTIARGELWADDHFARGVVNGEWTTTFPSQVTVDEAFLHRGRERFNIYCTPCHGWAGFGDGIVHLRADRLVNAGINGSTWVAPKSLHEQTIRDQPIGQVFSTITNGVRTMPSYSAQISREDRWAIVAYVKALQWSQNADTARGAVPMASPAQPGDVGSRPLRPLTASSAGVTGEEPMP